MSTVTVPPGPQNRPQPQEQMLPAQISSAAILSYLYTCRRYPLDITSDTNHSKSSNILHAVLEVPGV
jgi:hypothetical protein